MREATSFPEECMDLGVRHMECAVARREFAYQTAQQLAGRDAVDRVLPNYEENRTKAMEHIELYKKNVAGGKWNKDAFWG